MAFYRHQRQSRTVRTASEAAAPRSVQTSRKSEEEEEELPIFTDSEDELDDEPGSSNRPSDDEGGPIIAADGTVWGKKALEAARKVLCGAKMEGLELYSFRAIANGAVLDVRLDKLDDRYGSPTLDEIEAFSRSFYAELSAALGEEEAGNITVEVSSPGAERALRIPADLHRFQELPMSVSYSLEEGRAGVDTKVLLLDELAEAKGLSVWKLANVRLNRPAGKGSRLTKKQTLQRFRIPLGHLQKVKLYIEI